MGTAIAKVRGKVAIAQSEIKGVVYMKNLLVLIALFISFGGIAKADDQAVATEKQEIEKLKEEKKELKEKVADDKAQLKADREKVREVRKKIREERREKRQAKKK